MNAFHGLFFNKTVLVTGHTGFKGAWLCEWLLLLGARVHGLALEAPPEALCHRLDLLPRLAGHRIGDIRDAALVRQTVEEIQPDFVFHLAAQPLVRLSYEQPLETYAVNVMGTLHVLEALRVLKKPCAAVFVTTDKCYENREWFYAYREDDPMGGFDPYSSSKGMAELGIAAYRRSFFANHPVRIASARAGNVIGGGDQALDRIVPDCIHALEENRPIGVRNPHATRPWQHVLEPLSGYLWLAASLSQEKHAPSHTLPALRLDTSFNFGPGPDANRTVGELVAELLKHWPGTWQDQSDPHAPHEASLLQLSTEKARHLLNWSAAWNFSDAVKETVAWYRCCQPEAEPTKIRTFTQAQIATYTAAAARAGLLWTKPPLSS